MVEYSRQSLTCLLPIVGGAATGLMIAGLAALLPASVLEAVTESSGIAAVLPVAAPPLGATARAVLALGGGLAIAAVVWAALYLLVGPGGSLAPRAKAFDRPTVRRADAHPDAPPRRPLSAEELPVPGVTVQPPVEADVPADLNLPLASYDPDALLPVPMPPAQPVKPLAAALAPGERLETFTLSPPPPPAPPRRADEPPSIDALLRRLEQGARQRASGRTAGAH